MLNCPDKFKIVDWNSFHETCKNKRGIFTNPVTSNLIKMLRLLKNTRLFSTEIHRVSDIIQNVKIIVETSDTRLLTHCVTQTLGRKRCQTEILEMAMEMEKKISFASNVTGPLSRVSSRGTWSKAICVVGKNTLSTIPIIMAVENFD